MPKQSALDKALADVDAKIDVLRQVREVLLATKQATVTLRKKKAKPEPNV